MTFERRGERVYACTDWPAQLTVDRAFLAAADPEYVTRHGARIDFSVANGHATYTVVRDDSRLPTLLCQKCGSVYDPTP